MSNELALTDNQAVAIYEAVLNEGPPPDRPPPPEASGPPPLAPAEVRAALSRTDAGKALVDEWGRYGASAFTDKVTTAQRTAGAILAEIPGERRKAALLESFGRQLPDDVQKVVYDALAQGRVTFARPASREDLARFKADAEGSQIAAGWGEAAAERLGRVQSQVEILEATLTPAQRTALWAWVDRLDHPSFAAIVRALSK